MSTLAERFRVVHQSALSACQAMTKSEVRAAIVYNGLRTPPARACKKDLCSILSVGLAEKIVAPFVEVSRSARKIRGMK